MNRPEIITFGCRLNAYESEAIRLRAAAAGVENTIVFNTCAVTAEAVRQSRQAIRKARRANPNANIIVTGCAAQTEPGTFAAMPEVDRILGNEEKLKQESYTPPGTGTSERVRVNDIFSVRETAAQFVDAFDGRARAFVQVQNGCDHRCTFCIIPFGRGNARSVPMGSVVEEARRLVENGFGEIVLTGVDLTSYGADLPGRPTLGQLCVKLLKLLPSLKRLRVSSIDSIEADPALLRVIAEAERFAPHIHLSAQSGDDMILKRMKRRHLRKDTIAFCETVRRLRPEAAFGADLITGFPTETEPMFENTLKLVDDAGLSYLHVFPFSARTGTPAARMPQVAKPVIKDRAARLREKGASAIASRLESLVGTSQIVLSETHEDGRTACFAPVKICGGTEPGTFQPARIVAATGTHLIAELT
ncbi:MAG: tRNA (N(6)-L-threonylcarbamoyladenosine(37)-C(2))-methylthiotransferase MtaB [Alphaproteobacteria bacterium]|nr:tRNA (N(6)-L-threonylcarbamoyladenosine(37)-C(2))-methylthiotransferase MtaB [Alphaproteobacteria bacterium]